MKYIRYTGDDLTLRDNHSNVEWAGKIALIKNKIYQLYFDWDGKMELNGYWTFYICNDELLPVSSRGYELKVSDVETIRSSNLDLILL